MSEVHKVYPYIRNVDVSTLAHGDKKTRRHTHTHSLKCKCFSGEVRIQALGILALLPSVLHSSNRRHAPPTHARTHKHTHAHTLPRERPEKNIAVMLV